jgi:low affinity Fe/Cu permease
MRDAFRKFADHVSRWAGSSWAFTSAVLILIIWGITGPLFGFSDSWQLVINTGTTIVTFLMVFLIQNTQNRETRAINLKLDELLRAMSSARNEMIDMENVSEEEMEEVEDQFHQISRQIREKEGHNNHSARKNDPGGS